ncbi:glycoside hydrolase family 36 protein [Arachnia propionica]|uniref:Alpha-galactosidase n=1 Tax=Arachnia propionica TaxID=1750 RepID=A0A3P1WQU7_9ACTN|nr:glycoside hydrolase family 36 protein [Arachnia propionica]RRD48157.1 alpha-galactosidase [Arachnia propionica]
MLTHGTPTSAPTWAPATSPLVAETHFETSRLSLLHGMPHDAEVYRSGQNSWSPAGWRPLAGEPLRIENPVRRNTADDDRWDDPVRHHSSWLLALGDGVTAVLLGALEGDTPRLHADLDVLTGWNETGRPGRWVLLEGPELAVLERYRDLLAARHGVRDRDPGTVWSSWYSFYETISRDSLGEVLPELPGLGFDTFQIDDGWQRVVGDWSPNGKFPDGMAELARKAADLGLRAGLWLAPFIVLPTSEAFTTRRQMLLTDAAGDPVPAGANWGSPYFTYDHSRDDVHDHLAELVHRAVDDWGFTYLKLDFLQAATVPGVHAVPSDREAVYRRAIHTIREAAGEGTYLLGSGAPLFPSLGILDAVRTGPDVAPMWTNYATSDPSDAMALNALRNAVERLWLRGLIGVDPDVVFARHSRNLLSRQQMQWLQDAATLSGFRALSDPPGWLTDEERDDLRRFLGPLPATARLGRYRFLVGEREVDFAPALHGTPSPYAL